MNKMLTYFRYSLQGGMEVHANAKTEQLLSQVLVSLKQLLVDEQANLPFTTGGKQIITPTFQDLLEKWTKADQSKTIENVRCVIESYETYTQVLGRSSIRHSLIEIPIVSDA